MDVARRYAHLVSHSATAALCRCLPGVCPWCILKSRHGDVAHALSLWQTRRDGLPEGCARGRFVLQHVKTWIVELTQADIKEELVEPTEADPTEIDTESTEPPERFSVWTPSASSALPASSFCRGCPQDASKSTTPSGGRSSLPQSRPLLAPPPGLPPPPPPPLPLVSPRRGGGVMLQSSREPPFVPTSWVGTQVWQFWAGRKSRWRDYSLEISAALSFMALYGPAEADFDIQGWRYRINIVNLTQNNAATDSGPRAIRRRPVDAAD